MTPKMEIVQIQQAKRRAKPGLVYRGLPPTPQEFSDEQKRVMHAVEDLAHTCGYEASHTHHVTRLALRLFNELRPLHHLGTTERFYLQAAGILHDIGWIEGRKDHHKASLKIILHTSLLPINHQERLLIGSIARYHSGSIPSLDHDHFAALNLEDRKRVLILAAILRLADALDRTHAGKIETIQCKITDHKIHLLYTAPHRLKKDEKSAYKGSQLLQVIFKRGFSIERVKDKKKG